MKGDSPAFLSQLTCKAASFLVLFLLFSLLVSCSANSNETSNQSNEISNDIEDKLSDEANKEVLTDNSKADGADDKSTDLNGAGENEAETFVFPEKGVRPIAVMIDNQGTKCLPQGGLDKAQVIYEVIVEGGLTRLMLIFWGNEASLIGPVRSARHYFLDYAMEHDAIYVHYGWSPRAIEDIRNLKINNIDGVGSGGSIFWDLTNDKNNWQDSYTSMEKIQSFSAKAGYRKSTDRDLVFAYNKEDIELVDGVKAENVFIKYSSSYNCSFTYDAATGLYKRFKEGQPQMERVTGKQLMAKNIIIQRVKNYNIAGDSEGRQDLDTVGSGSGMYITRGKAINIKWSKSKRNSATQYTDENGNEISLNPGQTWVQIVPLNAKITFE